MTPFIAALIPVIFLAQTPADAKAANKALESLQGQWNLVSSVREGAEVPRERLKNSPKHTIEGDRWIPGRDPNDFSTISLNPASKPKSIDITDRGGNLMLGVYELKEDKLTICIARPGSPRPRSLSLLVRATRSQGLRALAGLRR